MEGDCRVGIECRVSDGRRLECVIERQAEKESCRNVLIIQRMVVYGLRRGGDLEDMECETDRKEVTVMCRGA